MANQPLIISAATEIDGLVAVVDGFLNREHVISTEIGNEPIEDGSLITDHATHQPQVLRLRGVVSDLNGVQKSQDAYAALVRISESEEPVRVITEWQAYEEMLIKRVAPVTHGRGMRFEMVLQEIQRVPAAVFIPPPRSGLSRLARILAVDPDVQRAAFVAAAAGGPAGVSPVVAQQAWNAARAGADGLTGRERYIRELIARAGLSDAARARATPFLYQPHSERVAAENSRLEYRIHQYELDRRNISLTEEDRIRRGTNVDPRIGLTGERSPTVQQGRKALGDFYG